MEHFLVSVFTLLRRNQHTGVFIPATEVSRGFKNVTRELLELGVHVLSGWRQQKLVVAVLTNLVDHWFVGIPNDLICCQRSDGH